jgi:hypothetical protein
VSRSTDSDVMFSEPVFVITNEPPLNVLASIPEFALIEKNAEPPSEGVCSNSRYTGAEGIPAGFVAARR